MRPWVTTIGGISWSTINRLFAALVGQLHKPAILLTEMCQLFEPVLSHVESLVLIEVVKFSINMVLLFSHFNT